MSAAFKNAAKKKISQLELRKYMNEQKGKLQKKIESPLAKYLDNGQLMCILCKSIVRSEAVWTVHINSKQHKENIALAKKLKEETVNFTQSNKRPKSPDIDEPNKKIKGILKSSANTANTTCQEVPEDFFDSVKNSVNKNETVQFKDLSINNDTSEKMEVSDTPEIASEKLPEGFFDDPKLDAKARNLEYKDPVEEEWEKFQKEIKEVNSESAAIIAEDQEEATAERQIEEIDEQLRNWSRVLDLERKKESLKAELHEQEMKEAEESSEDEDEFDEYLDWRAKKSFK